MRGRDRRRRGCDVILVWKLDRPARSLRELVNIGAELEALGVDLVCATQSIDTTTPTGRLLFAVLAALAEFERDLIRERVCAGLDRARRAGRKLGRRPVRVDIAHALAMRNQGRSLRQVARALGVSRGTLVKALGAPARR